VFFAGTQPRRATLTQSAEASSSVAGTDEGHRGPDWGTRNEMVNKNNVDNTLPIEAGGRGCPVFDGPMDE
jgi:hypothetical protein